MKKKKTFGGHIRILRTTRQIGQRELARMIGVSPSYLNDIESNKRTAPRKEIIKQIADILEANLENLYDLAGKSQNRIPPDIPSIIKKNKEIPLLLRNIEKYELTSNEIKEIRKQIEEANVKAIIIAAGMGDRLKPYTDDLPKCMLEFGGKTLPPASD